MTPRRNYPIDFIGYTTKQLLFGELLSNDSFRAKPWLQNMLGPVPTPEDPHMSELLASLNFNSQNSTHSNSPSVDGTFSPNKYFLSGWSGSELSSKNGLELKRILDLIETDVQEKLFSFYDAPKRFKNAIFDEFLTFADERAINFSDLDNYQVFWSHLKKTHSPYREQLDLFIANYCKKITIIFFSKLRLISVIIRESGKKITKNELINPNAFFTSIFKSNASSELKSKAIQTNQYSWYRPSDSAAKNVFNVFEIISDISHEELLKIISQKLSTGQTSTELSSKPFGNLLTSMILTLPQWLQRSSHNNNRRDHKSQSTIEVVSCKFSGDHLEEIAHSHILAQESNKLVKWDSIICPEFVSSEFKSGNFLQLNFEIHFLTFLAILAKQHNYQGNHCNMTSFICGVVNDQRSNKSKHSNSQRSLLSGGNNPADGENYDRIVLNLTDRPKRNAHSDLVNRISKEKAHLKDDGYLIVLSSQKLFIASQKEKIDQLLRGFKIECCFSLKKLKGRGKIAPYIYIFSKRSQVVVNHGLFANSKKQPCLSFQIEGNLKSINDFSTVIYELERFYHKYSAALPPLYRKEYNNSFEIDFHKDAIVDGRLVNFASKDSSKITHPAFVTKLLKACVPLENFFNIKKIQQPDNRLSQIEETEQTPNIPFLENKFFRRDYYPYIIIVDLRDPEKTNLELISYDVFQSKSLDYGFAYCQYFGVTPKLKFLNLNLFRYFFDSKIGQQLVDITFTERSSNTRDKLASLLVPTFFGDQAQLPPDVARSLSFLQVDEEGLLSKHPQKLRNSFAKIEQVMHLLKTKYPSDLLNSLSKFASTLQDCVTLTKNKTNKKCNFSNPLIQEPLLKLQTRPIFPDNEDVYIDLSTKDMAVLNLPLTAHKVIHNHSAGENHSSIELYSKDRSVATLHCQRNMAEFIDYIIPQAYSHKIATILQGIEVPYIDELIDIMKHHKELNEELQKLLGKSGQMIDSIFQQQIAD